MAEHNLAKVRVEGSNPFFCSQHCDHSSVGRASDCGSECRGFEPHWSPQIQTVMDKEFTKRFLTNRDETGRFIVKSMKTGKLYFVECLDDDERTTWGDLDPVTKKMTGSYGDKYKGSIRPEESMIKEGIGFDKIHTLGPGESPLDYINRIDDEYFEKMKSGRIA